MPSDFGALLRRYAPERHRAQLRPRPDGRLVKAGPDAARRLVPDTNVYIKDLMTCHKVIRTDVFRALPLREPGFAIEAEITARLLQRGERIFEMPVHYRARATHEGKKLTAKDGFRTLRTLVRCRLARAA